MHWYAATEDITSAGLYFCSWIKHIMLIPNTFLATEAWRILLSKGVHLDRGRAARLMRLTLRWGYEQFLKVGRTECILNLNGGPNWANNNADSQFWTLQIRLGSTSSRCTVALVHFSAYKARNSTRIRVDSTSKSALKAPAECTAFKTPSGHIVLVVLNKGSLSTTAVQCDVRKKLY